MSRRRHRSQLSSRTVDVEVRGHSSLCSHDRVGYPSRAAAHRRALQVRKDDPAGQRLRPYECTDLPGTWHLGILPDEVVAGVVTAAEYYAGPQPVAGGKR